MSSGLILDNWALQDIGDLLVEGPQPGSASEIIVDTEEDSHHFKDVPHFGIQVEALLDLLVDIVLYDAIYVDTAFTGSWGDKKSIFNVITQSGLLRQIPFLDQEPLLTEPRRTLLDGLCITSTLRKEQLANEESWRSHGCAADRYTSALIWGTAGMLGRSHVFDAQYHSHPARKRLLEQTTLVSPRMDAAREVINWIDSERLRLFEIHSGGGSARRATLIMPPLAIEILEEANSPYELIGIAFQKRDKYRKLREWLKDIQSGLNTDAAKPYVKLKRTLNAISRDLDAMLGKHDNLPVSMSFTYGIPSVNIEMPIMSGIRRRFGVSAVLNQTLFKDRGGKTLKHLLKLFGERDNTMELALIEYLGQVGRTSTLRGKA